ncbi:MAG: DUF3667 domain-containing protein [Alphaproteobacteria bacterium]|nr:MAG: DUF3667 domain-containing protein [Alphaproteobacteria bacterium]
MVSGIEGVGEAITGGVIARAVEPQAGEATHDEGGNCLNCGAELAGPYCHRCGQQGHVHRTLGAFFHDLLHGVLHFEGKIWRTLPLLAWRPGELTRRYIHGERARFVSPIALFLFSVFLMFAVFSVLGGPFGAPSRPEASPEAAAEIARETRQLDQSIASLQQRRETLAARHQSTVAIDAQLRVLRQQRQAIGAAESFVLVPSAAPERTSRTIDLSDAEIDTGFAWLDHAIGKARDNPSLLLYKLETNAYKFSWALIPISVPFVWLLFLHRRRYRAYRAYDHVVFVTYSIAFMSLFLVTLSLLRALWVPEAVIGLAFTFVPPIHIYRDLRGAYQLGRFSALWRTAALLAIAFLAAMIFFVLLLALGALG